MNTIKTDTIIDPNHQQGFTGYSVPFLQNAYKVILDGLAQSLIGENYDSSKAYVLKGLTAYGTNQYHEGYVLFQNEIYYSAGKSTTTAFVHVPVLNITSVATAPADPCPFSDGTTESRHFTRTLTLADAVSGDIILSSAIYIQADAWNEVGNDSGATTYTAGWAGASVKLSYKVDARGFVKLKGSAAISSGSAVTPFVLPAGFRPPASQAFIIVDTTTPAAALLTIDASGNVTFFGSVAPTKTFDFSSIGFYNY